MLTAIVLIDTDAARIPEVAAAIAESIKRHLRGIDEAVLVNSRHHVLFTRGPASEVNGQAG